MLCDVTLLRQRGQRLRPSELHPPVRGDLCLEQAADAHTSFRRPVLTAKLKGRRGATAEVDVLLPIFDVRVLAISKGITLIGIELATGDGRISECVQIWRCEPVGARSGGEL